MPIAANAPTMRTDRGSPVALLFATSGHSGVDRVVSNLVVEFGRYPLDFHLLTIRGHGPHPARLPDNVRPMRLAAAHRNTVLPSLLFYLLRHRPRALYTASHRLNRMALLARRLVCPRMPVAIRMGMSVSGMLTDLRPRRARALRASMQRWYSRAEAVIAPSLGVGTDLIDIAGVAPECLHIIPNPIVTALLREQAAEPTGDPWLDTEVHEIPVILGAGSLEPRKDFATLIRAFAQLRRHRDTRLVILGEGPERAPLDQLARDLGVHEHLRMPGFRANPYAWMARANAFALTSRREGSGAVLVEALACGTPAVTTNCPTGPADILGNGALGPVVPVGDDVALAHALRELLETPAQPSRLQLAVGSFDAARSARAYLHALGLASPPERAEN